MYVTIKLPPEFGAFNRIRKENYPFNTLFTSYLAAISKLGLTLGLDVDGVVGYIEDRIFDGQRLPDIPDGAESVNIRYKVPVSDEKDENCPGMLVKRYIEGSSLTNRMAVMYIARMTLRLSAAYGTSLLRLRNLISELEPGSRAKKPVKLPKQEKQETPKPKPAKKEEAKETPLPMPRVSAKAKEQDQAPEPQAAPSESAKAAMEAVSALAGLMSEAGEASDSPVVETNPFLNDFL